MTVFSQLWMPGESVCVCVGGGVHQGLKTSASKIYVSLYHLLPQQALNTYSLNIEMWFILERWEFKIDA